MKRMTLRYFTARNFRQMVDPSTGQELNLSYITPQLIAMCFPSEGVESLYRNQLSQVAAYLDANHGGNYKVYNLCLERKYQETKFNAPVARYPFSDHTPPALDQVMSLCEDVDAYITEDPLHVAVIHCKAGKGRTGTMISAYLLYCGGALSPDDAMEVFGQLRTRDGKGVTIPSQKRFVRYFAEVLKDRSLLVSQPVKLWSITLRFMDSIERIQSMTEAWRVYIFDRKENCEERIHKQKLNQLPLATSSGGYKELTIPCGCLELCGDIRVECRSTAYISSTSVFHFWFNTTFVSRPEIPGVELVAHGTSQRARFTVNKDDLDGAIRLGTIDASLMNQLQVQLEFDF